MLESCFWCTESIFQRIRGVSQVIPGYMGGFIKNPSYREVCTGKTGHAKPVKITYDQNVVSYRALLEIFFLHMILQNLTGKAMT